MNVDVSGEIVEVFCVSDILSEKDAEASAVRVGEEECDSVGICDFEGVGIVVFDFVFESVGNVSDFDKDKF